MVARKTGPSSDTDMSSPGRGHDTSTLIGSFGAGGAALPKSRAGSGGGADSSCSGIVLIWDSNDCADTTRSFGGALNSGGVGELGWLRYGDGAVSIGIARQYLFMEEDRRVGNSLVT